MISPSIKTKYIFLSFLQQYFKEHVKYTWDIDPSKTKIVITDKFSTDLGIAAMRPTIILDRGSFNWSNMYRNEALPLPKGTDFPRLSHTRLNNYSLKDQLSGSLTLNIMNKNPLGADEIANEIFVIISGYREWFKEKGIHKFNGLGVSKENIVRVGANGVEVTNVSVQISFNREEKIIFTERLFNARVYKDGEEIFEGIDYVILSTGTQIKLKNADPSATFTIDYVDAVTLEEVLGASLIMDSEDNRVYSLSSSGSVYGYYNLFEAFEASKDSQDWIESK